MSSDRKAGLRMFLLMFAVAGVAGCDMPRDAQDTQERIVARGQIRLGAVAGAPREPAAERAVAAAAAKLGVTVSRSTGETETLLGALETGELDLVYGSFATNSPWKTHVHLGNPPGWRTDPPKEREVPRFAYRNGENGWIMTMERAVK